MKASDIQFNVMSIKHYRSREYDYAVLANNDNHSLNFGWTETDDKSSVELFSPVTLKLGAINRCNASIDTVNAMVLDFDSGESIDDIVVKLNPLGFWGHTTHSHTDEHPKFRIIIPMTAPVKAEEWRGFWSAFIADLRLTNDKSCCDPARIYYKPSHRVGAVFGEYYDFGEYGMPIDTDLYLEIARRAKKVAPRPISNIISRLERPESHVDWNTFDIHAFLSRHNIESLDSTDKVWCRCPWSHNHSNQKSDTIKDAYFHRFNDRIGFHCSHSHCHDKWIGSVMQELDGEAFCQPVPTRA